MGSVSEEVVGKEISTEKECEERVPHIRPRFGRSSAKILEHICEGLLEERDGTTPAIALVSGPELVNGASLAGWTFFPELDLFLPKGHRGGKKKYAST
jgi:hypothetical protein